MKYSMLWDAISLLKELRSYQSNTEGCVIQCLDQVIQNLESLRFEKCSEPELSAMILQEFDVLFSEFPEINLQLKCLAELLSE